MDVIDMFKAMHNDAAISIDEHLDIHNDENRDRWKLIREIRRGIFRHEVCQQLKQSGQTRDIPVIFLTAMDDVNDVVKGFELGGADYITKPFNPAIVLQRVNTQIELKEARDRLAQDGPGLPHLRCMDRFGGCGAWGPSAPPRYRKNA